MINENPFKMPVSDQKPCLEHLLYWVWEREVIRIAKENGYEGDLTQDPILKQYRFCNVRRRDDRVSKWIIENLLVPATYDDDTDIWFIAAIARYVNWPPALRELLEAGAIPRRVEQFDPDLFGKVLTDITESGGKAWGGAYMTYPTHLGKGQPKGYSTARYILAPLKEKAEQIREAVKSNKLENVSNAILGAYGWQPFMVGQVAADLSYIQEFEDVYSWAPMGPGSQRGLNRLYGFSLNKNWNQYDFNLALIGIRAQIMAELKINDLTLHDVQNCMCEIDKYWRVLYGEGRPRATYKPETAY